MATEQKQTPMEGLGEGARDRWLPNCSEITDSCVHHSKGGADRGRIRRLAAPPLLPHTHPCCSDTV